MTANEHAQKLHPPPRKQPTTTRRIQAWARRHPQQARRWSRRLIARELGVWPAQVTRAIGPLDDGAVALWRDGREAPTASGLPPVPDQVQTELIIDNGELFDLIARWRRLHGLDLRRREADHLFASRLHEPLTRLVAATAAKMPSRALLNEDARVGCLGHLTAFLIEKYDARRTGRNRVGNALAWIAYRYLLDCTTGGKSSRLVSETLRAYDRIVTREVDDGPDVADRVEVLRARLGASTVRSLGDPVDGRRTVKFVVYHKPFASSADLDLEASVDPREYGDGWDPFDDRLILRRVVRGYLAEVLDAVGDVELGRGNPETRIREAWKSWRRKRGLTPRVDDDTWAEVVDGLRQLRDL